MALHTVWATAAKGRMPPMEQAKLWAFRAVLPRSGAEGACKEHGFKPWQGSNSKKGPHAQPGDIGDVLLHETAISWMRRREEATRPTKPWEETPHDVAARLQAAVCHVNEQFEVRALCMEFPQRLSDLVNKTRGDRLPK